MKRKFKAGIMLIAFFFGCGYISFAQEQVEQWNRFELALKHTYNGNAFANVKLTATFTGKDSTYIVDGFYDGDNTFKIRFMPQQPGAWQYVTSSNIKQLNNQRGAFVCEPASRNNHGIVRVSNTFSFKYADGKQYYPVGTTAYAWNHMSEAVQQMTLETLKQSGFNKLRMCVFPKDYNLVKVEPTIYPFLSTGME